MQNNTTASLLQFNDVQIALKEIDHVIQQCRNTTDHSAVHLEKAALKATLALGGYMTDSDEDVYQQVQGMLSNPQSISNKRPMACCFLRLLHEPTMTQLKDRPLRGRIVTLLDSQFADDVYAERKIDPQLQTHEKIDRLVQIVDSCESSFSEALAMLTGLERLNAHRQKLLAVLNNRSGKALIGPFLPPNTQSLLTDLYSRVEGYLESKDSPSVVDVHGWVVSETEHFISTLELFGTQYCLMLADKVGKRIAAFIEDDFTDNRIVQPATVAITARSKKYPLHLPGTRVDMGFIIENQGPGCAFDVALTVIIGEGGECLSLSNDEIQVGRIDPGTQLEVRVPAVVKAPVDQCILGIQVIWQDYRGNEHSSDSFFDIEKQRADLDWLKLEQEALYSLDPVTREEDLVGRKSLVNKLIGILQHSSKGSAIIKGQKRVGKTSIAKAIESNLSGKDNWVIYLEAGEYANPDVGLTIKGLGEKLCKQIRRKDQRIAHLSLPHFDNALSPLTDFFDDVDAILHGVQIVIILDEFDQLPLGLYMRGPIADSFFITLRSISSRPGVGLILIGGERMNYVLDQQSHQLNKWITIPVDYFSRSSDWQDYRELVQRPAAEVLEYSEDALIKLHENTAGNPYFTKLICQYVFQNAVDRRDCHITQVEVEEAADAATKESDRNVFQHFWEDYIFRKDDSEAAEISIRRRRILIAVSDALNHDSAARLDQIRRSDVIRNIDTLKADLDEFVNRTVLTTRKTMVDGQEQDTYAFKVPFFASWLRGRGVSDLITTFMELDDTLRLRHQQEKLKLQPEELVMLCNRWRCYNKKLIEPSHVQNWLNQFDEVRHQRTMFSLLEGLRFYSSAYIENKMENINAFVRRGLRREELGMQEPLGLRKLRHSDIVVSYLDSVGNSGAMMAKAFADTAKLYVDNIVEKSMLARALNEKHNIQALVFVDDFVGTGNTVASCLQDLDSAIGQRISELNLKVIFAAVLAYAEGWKHLETVVQQLKMGVELHYCELLGEEARCFSESSTVIKDHEQRSLAKSLALEYGMKLEKNCPLGYGDLEMAIVFEHNCPNNSLPILWSESKSPKFNWVPLFKRH